jgi:hypothetical protein
MMTNDEVDTMPWTRDLMTDEELRRWLAGRKEAGRAIDIETCELRWWYANDFDPYGILNDLGDLPMPRDECLTGRNFFVRSPESRGWVWEGDLSSETGHAMYDRINREADTYENYFKRPKEPPELWEAKHKLWGLVANYSAFISWKDKDRAAAAHEFEKLSNCLREWKDLHPDLVHSRTGDVAIVSVCNLVEGIAQAIIARPEELTKERQ